MGGIGKVFQGCRTLGYIGFGLERSLKATEPQNDRRGGVGSPYRLKSHGMINGVGLGWVEKLSESREPQKGFGFGSEGSSEITGPRNGLRLCWEGPESSQHRGISARGGWKGPLQQLRAHPQPWAPLGMGHPQLRAAAPRSERSLGEGFPPRPPPAAPPGAL